MFGDFWDIVSTHLQDIYHTVQVIFLHIVPLNAMRNRVVFKE